MKKHFEILANTRSQMIQFIGEYSLVELNQIPEGFRNNIIWNAGHALASQQLLTYGLAGLPIPMDARLIEIFRRGTAPGAPLHQGTIDSLVDFLWVSIPLLEENYESGKFKAFKPYRTGFGVMLNTIEDAIIFNNVHEGIHFGIMMGISKRVRSTER